MTRTKIAFLLLCLTVTTTAKAQKAGEDPKALPAAIPVVKTWKALQELPAIDLGDGVKIRLGLEADKIPQWSGALLYCLTEGYTPGSGVNGELPFGPVHASVAFGDAKSEKSIVKGGLGNGDWPKGQYLFLRAITADRVGKYQVCVTDRKGKLQAEATVEGTKDFFHPWMPWQQGLEKPSAPAEGIALPNVDRFGPATFIEPGKTKKGTLLALLPSDEKPGLTIKTDGKEIVIRAETEFTTSRPDYHFLARWWVNDKPFVPRQAETLWTYDGYGLVSAEKELRLTFEFRPDRLGAKPGDKIGLQLMHAECQWAWCADSSHSKLSASERKDGENVRVSNRIEFAVPK